MFVEERLGLGQFAGGFGGFERVDERENVADRALDVGDRRSCGKEVIRTSESIEVRLPLIKMNLPLITETTSRNGPTVKKHYNVQRLQRIHPYNVLF